MKKKILALIATAAVAALMVPAFAFAADANNVDPETCDHDWQVVTLKERTAPCGDNVVGPACTKCHTVDNAKVEHIAGTGEHAWVYTRDEGNFKPCEVGFESRTCSVCGDRDREYYEQVPPIAEHQWGDLGVVPEDKDAPACKTVHKAPICKVCGRPDRANVVAEPGTAEHQWGAAEVVLHAKAPCGTSYKAAKCTVCGDFDIMNREAVPGNGQHEWAEIVDEPLAPCGATYKYMECRNCSEWKEGSTVVTPGTGAHQPGRWVEDLSIDQFADESIPEGADGCFVRFQICDACHQGISETREFYHKWDGDKCSNCGKVRTEATTATDSEPSVLAETGDPLNAGAFGFAAVAAALVGVVAFRRFNNAA